MSIQNWSDEIILVSLPHEPRLCREIGAVNDILSTQGPRDVVVDFSSVDIFTSASISNLLILHKLTLEAGRRLVLVSVGITAKCIFRIAGLNEVFEFADDRFAALDSIQHACAGA